MSIEMHSSESRSINSPSVRAIEADEDSIESNRPPAFFFGIIALGPILGAVAGIGITNTDSISNNFNAATAFNERNDKASALISDIADMPMRVNCDDTFIDSMLFDADDGSQYGVVGFVEPVVIYGNPVSLPVMTVRDEICDEVINADLTPAYTDTSSDEYFNYLSNSAVTASALEVLIHESEHIKQVHNEAETSCYSMQKLPGALEELGMNEADAEAVARRVLADNTTSMPNEYYTEECIAGGEYDLGINDLYLQQGQPEVAINQ